ncbi:MAG: hypothetical protein HUJ16_12100 [Kangiella sp.]|nr:hypothetical protein [Kangiella sp.]
MTAMDGGNASTAGAVLVNNPAFIFYAVLGRLMSRPFYLEFTPIPL